MACFKISRFLRSSESLIPSNKQIASGSDKSFLPLEIIINILKRLPVKSLVRFRPGCKDWKNLFKSQSFIAEHVRHSAHEPFSSRPYYNNRRQTLRFLNHKKETVDVLSTRSFDSFRRGWRIIGSCNGWLCVELDTEKRRFPIWHLLWNPVINEVREVPQSLVNDYRRISSVGFGFSSVVNDYKM